MPDANSKETLCQTQQLVRQQTNAQESEEEEKALFKKFGLK